MNTRVSIIFGAALGTIMLASPVLAQGRLVDLPIIDFAPQVYRAQGWANDAILIAPGCPVSRGEAASAKIELNEAGQDEGFVAIHFTMDNGTVHRCVIEQMQEMGG